MTKSFLVGKYHEPVGIAFFGRIPRSFARDEIKVCLSIIRVEYLRGVSIYEDLPQISPVEFTPSKSWCGLLKIGTLPLIMMNFCFIKTINFRHFIIGIS